MTTDKSLQLAAGFPAATEADWLALVAKVLKGGSFEKRLVSRSADGVEIRPLYGRRTDRAPLTRAAMFEPWRVCQRVDHPDPGQSSALALADLDGGTNELALMFAGAQVARGYGLAADTVAALDAALAGVMLDLISLRIEPGAAGRTNAALVAALVERRTHAPGSLSIDFGLDPIGSLATSGALSAPWADIGGRLAETVLALAARGYTGPFATVDARPYHEAGASEGQELAAALATGVAYLRVLTEHGQAPAEALRSLSFVVAMDADQLLGIAKLRALRALWAQVEAAMGLEPRPARIHAETAWRMLSRRDPWVNMLRATMATFVAGVGGADSLTVLPHTAALGLPDAFARRIARNTQIVLIEESGLARVGDPAAGAGAFETLTDDLAKLAWGLFQDIEREGGIVESLAAGHLQRRIAATRTVRLRDVATRKSPITGSSEFADLAEAPVKVLDVAADSARGLPQQRGADPTLTFVDTVAKLARGASRGNVTPPPAAELTAPTLPSVRLAEPFEVLRDLSDAMLAATGRRPRVFLASLGAAAEHSQRSTWIGNLLAAGGIEAIATDGFTASGECGRAFAASGAGVACICGTDEAYELLGEASAMALKGAGARRVLLAGRPGDREAALRQAGVDGFIHAGQDMVALLGELHWALGSR